ncbi:peramine synthetase [Fusarium langsethiae]|uniref:Peramine synthetase n=1 Tax=Fusarium langsethiae TaxID=179993 RepID=A0A0M9ERF4_FUSLA|nr:peramine synthetase [Fusarium langsethiae]GKU06668.1 unnamed protein product [Fusarium langsethiae]GKU21850.1 unnamed protein product [Fusarium langsethiae]
MQIIWSEVLNIKPDAIGIHDGFMQLGGNSLDAMRMVTMARQAGMNLIDEDSKVYESATQKVHPTHLLADVARHDDQIAAVPLNLDRATDTEYPRKRPTVLFTGANGFIGTQILPKKWDLVKNGEIDMIVHNAALVHFLKGYDVLKPVNIASTVEMLCVASSNPVTSFVYVSSARHKDPTKEDEESVARHLAANSNGYMQTKFVSETLGKRAAHRNANGRNRFTIVSPGLVIGTLTDCCSNTDD